MGTITLVAKGALPSGRLDRNPHAPRPVNLLVYDTNLTGLNIGFGWITNEHLVIDAKSVGHPVQRGLEERAQVVGAVAEVSSGTEAGQGDGARDKGASVESGRGRPVFAWLHWAHILVSDFSQSLEGLTPCAIAIFSYFAGLGVVVLPAVRPRAARAEELGAMDVDDDGRGHDDFQTW